MSKIGKQQTAAKVKVDRTVTYGVSETVAMVKDASFAKFDETVDVTVRLGVDPRKADQMVRGAVVLPNGLGKTIRVLVFAKGEKAQEAQEAGADYVGGDDAAGDPAVGYDHTSVVRRSEDRAEDGDLLDDTRHASGFDEVTHLERSEDDQHHPGCKVA